MSSAALLADFYASFRTDNGLREAIQAKMSPPLLMMATETWFGSKDRILVVGQEARWEKKSKSITSFLDFKRMPGSVTQLQKSYEEFCFAKGRRKIWNSPFWRAYRAIREAFDGPSEGVDTEVLWTNLYKCSRNGKTWYGKRNAKERKQVEDALRGTLLRE